MLFVAESGRRGQPGVAAPTANFRDVGMLEVRIGEADEQASPREEPFALPPAHLEEVLEAEGGGGAGTVMDRMSREVPVVAFARDDLLDGFRDGCRVHDQALVLAKGGGGDERVVVEADMGKGKADDEGAHRRQSRDRVRR